MVWRRSAAKRAGWIAAGVSALAFLAAPHIAAACGYQGCEPHMSLDVSSYDCAGSALIGPRNDTRINLAWLLRGMAAGQGAQAHAGYAPPNWENARYGHMLLSWESMQQTFWPSAEQKDLQETWDDPYYATRCQTLASGGEAFRAALASAAGLGPQEREVLSGARGLLKATCDGDKAQPAWPGQITSAQGREFLHYLQGAQAFYAEDFARARVVFEGLSDASNAWIAETARYMTARNELAAAQAGAVGEWGEYDNTKADHAAAERGRQGLDAYLAAYPEGRYAGSASGLIRRALWLKGEAAPLSQAYHGFMAKVPFASPAMPGALEEVESKLFFTSGLAGTIEGPLLLATWDLARMRQSVPEWADNAPPALTRADLAAQAPVFANTPELYTLLKASHAYHVAGDMGQVLTLVPESVPDAPVGFSLQVLRGLALEKSDARAAASHWERLLPHAGDLYQRPAVELALAMNRERSGRISDVFAPQSGITQPEIRGILLQHGADAALLRQQAAGGQDRFERDLALFTLLYKTLSRGRYADFLEDLARVPADAGLEGSYLDWRRDEVRAVPLARFTRGTHEKGYPCGTLAETARSLQRDSADPGALLCLGEFWRLNGFDKALGDEQTPPSAELGGVARGFSGKAMPRSAIYEQVLASAKAGGNEKAYALYRAVRCYAPAGISSCGGESVDEAQREAWFRTLKRDYPQSQWARSLKYYW